MTKLNIQNCEKKIVKFLHVYINNVQSLNNIGSTCFELQITQSRYPLSVTDGVATTCIPHLLSPLVMQVKILPM